MIGDQVKAKSVVFTDEGLAESERGSESCSRNR
jgi:hypothetical protein